MHLLEGLVGDVGACVTLELADWSLETLALVVLLIEVTDEERI